ncbi:unnamed protein product [Urochloa humidicola]
MRVELRSKGTVRHVRGVSPSRMDEGARSPPVFPIAVLPPLGSPMDGGRSCAAVPPCRPIHVRRFLAERLWAVALWQKIDGSMVREEERLGEDGRRG